MEDESLALTAAVNAPEFAPPPAVSQLLIKERETMLRQIGTGIKLTDAQQLKLARPATHEVVDFLPSGEIYVPGDKWRLVLNETFGSMAWGYRPGAVHMNVTEKESSSVLYREIFLIVSRCSKCYTTINTCKCNGAKKFEPVCVSTAIGAQRYHPKNARMTYDDAAEGASTNGLMRCCKPYGVYANIWDHAWANEARNQLALKVWVKQGYGHDSRSLPQWRLAIANPFQGESGLVDDSPNRDKYRAPQREKPARSEASQAAETKPGRPDIQVSQEAEPAQPAQKPPSDGEKILVVREVKYITSDHQNKVYWVVCTNHAEYITDSEETHREVESYRARGLKIHVESEVVRSTKGQRLKLTGIRPAKKE